MISLNYLASLKPQARAAYVKEHEADLAKLTENQLERVATLLCHASPKSVRSEYPIERDLNANKAQETFEHTASRGIEKAQAQTLEYTNGKAA